jgi:hypothetical protein
MSPLTLGGSWTVQAPTTDLQRLNTIVDTLDTDAGGSPLAFAVQAGVAYAFECYVFFSANGAQDARMTMGGPALTKLIMTRLTTDNTNTFNPTGPTSLTPAPWTAYPVTAAMNTSLGEFSGPFTFRGVVIPAANGLFGVSWAQQVASLVNPTTRLRGSWLSWKRVG